MSTYLSPNFRGWAHHKSSVYRNVTFSNAIVDYWKNHTDEPASETKVKNACAYAMRALDKKADLNIAEARRKKAKPTIRQF